MGRNREGSKRDQEDRGRGKMEETKGKKEACSKNWNSELYPIKGFFLEKEMATHSSTLALKIPWMEETGRLFLNIDV